MKLLREKGQLALKEVEGLLGWERRVGMSNRVMAGHLGISEGQLKRLIQGRYLQAKERERREAERAAKAITLAPQVSHKLGFSVSLPAGWQVITDTREIMHLAQEYSEMVRWSKPERTPRRRVFSSRRPDVCGVKNIIDVTDRLQAKREQEERMAEAERHARLERMTIGIFQAAPPDNDDEPFIEITTLRLDGPLTATDLYNLDKRLPEAVPWGNRPSNGLTVDALRGIAYYFVMHTGETPQAYATYSKQPAFFNVYLADELDGWLISCQCRCGEAYMKTFHRYKPLFRLIIGSFQRLHVR